MPDYICGMHYVTLNGISKSFGVRTLFRDISLHIEEGDKIALVARNGSGKTTLMKILAGYDVPDEGEVWVHKNIRTIMLQQEQDFDPDVSVWDNVLKLDIPVAKLVKEYEQLLESGSEDHEKISRLVSGIDELNGWNFESNLKQILGKLNIHHLNEKTGNLSGGQKKRVALAQALAEANIYDGRCLLILDEPTNHLDVSMIEWLEAYLSNQKMTILLVTHDRHFLDQVCNEILELDEEKIFSYKGNYDYFLEQKSHRIEVQQSELVKDKNIYRRELEWMRKQPKARTTKSRSREDAFARLEQKVKQQHEVSEVNLQVKMTRLGGKILELKKVYKQYAEKKILQGFDYTFKKGERIGIVGKNAVGKSTFLRIALQLERPDSGKVNLGDTVVFGNFNQEGLQFKEDKRAIEYVKSLAEFFPLSDGTKISAGQFMEKFGFTAQQQFTMLSKLSGGEKRRLHLLSILFKNPNFLVLDEPTNDLDLQTLRILEEFLLDFPGCMLIVSHDRYFMDRLVDHLFVFEGDGVIRDFPGNYSQYREAVNLGMFSSPEESEETMVTENTSSENIVPAKNKPSAPQKLSFKEKFEMEAIEKELPVLEKEKQELEAMLGLNIPYEELQKASNRISEIINSLSEKEMRWLELSEKSGAN